MLTKRYSRKGKKRTNQDGCRTLTRGWVRLGRNSFNNPKWNALFESGRVSIRVLKKGICLGLLVVGCSSSPKIVPKNEINEPVFHKTNFARLDVSLGYSWSEFDERFRIFGGSEDHVEGIYFYPGFQLEGNVNNWASYTLLPVFWNFLLTGEQYADSSNLKIRKLSLVLHGGISGISYSQRDSWVTSGSLVLTGKYLLSQSVFANATIVVDFNDLADMAHTINDFSLGIGKQMSAKNSIAFDYKLRHFNLPKYRGQEDQGIIYIDKDLQSELMFRHSFYASPKHILGPEIGYAYKNYTVLENHCLKLGAHYAFTF